MIEDQISIATENDIFYALSKVRWLMEGMGATEMDRQKVMVSVSELAHNILDHAGGSGYIYCECLDDEIRVVAIDHGPGIFNLDHILKGMALPTAHGLGKGLAGVHRLMDDVFIETSVGGTKIIATKWINRR